MSAANPEFSEIQRMVNSVWLRWICYGLALVLFASFLFGLQALLRRQVTGQGSITGVELVDLGGLLLGALIPVILVMWVKMITEVREDALYVRVVPFHLRFRRIPYGDIRKCAARKYRPIWEYGGWGIRWGWKGNAYNMYGNWGVQLEIAGRRPLLIGSQRPEELAGAILRRTAP